MELTKEEEFLLGKLNNFGLHSMNACFAYTENDTDVLFGLIEKIKEELIDNSKVNH